MSMVIAAIAIAASSPWAIRHRDADSEEKS